MQYEDGFLIADNMEDLVAFAGKMGGIELLAFKEPILDDKKKVLVQANRPLTASVVNHLTTREKQLQLNLILASTPELRAHVAQVVGNEIQKRLSSQADFTTALLNKKNFDIFNVMRGALGNDSFFVIVCRMLVQEVPILAHLIDTALLSVGLYAEARLGQAHISELQNVFQAGMLHDYALLGTSQWQELDSFPPDDDHDQRSYSLLVAKNLPDGVAYMIKGSNHLESMYSHLKNTRVSEKWYDDAPSLGQAIIKVVEYYFTALREFNTKEEGSKEETNQLQEILYLLSYQASTGLLAMPIISIFERHFEKYSKVFLYGDEIAKIERDCLHKTLALAYPKPRSVQVLCLDASIPCPWRVSTSPLNVVQQQNKSVTRTGKVLKPGWYYKCKLSDKLPEPPFTA